MVFVLLNLLYHFGGALQNVSYSGGVGNNYQPLILGKMEYEIGSDDFFNGIIDDVVISGLDL